MFSPQDIHRQKLSHLWQDLAHWLSCILNLDHILFQPSQLPHIKGTQQLMNNIMLQIKQYTQNVIKFKKLKNGFQLTFDSTVVSVCFLIRYLFSSQSCFSWLFEPNWCKPHSLPLTPEGSFIIDLKWCACTTNNLFILQIIYLVVHCLKKKHVRSLPRFWVQ